VLDILMPGIDGLDICKMMRADVEMAEIPVIFLSALDEDRLHQIADEAGATDYLCKPVSLADLLNLIGSYLKDEEQK
jgi:CheY-like chemotaxis protein